MTAALEKVKRALAPYPDLQIVLFDESTHTSELAAAAVGVAVAQIAKTLMFLADGAPVLVVACGDRKINTKKLGKELNAKKVRFADADSVLQITGFAPGGVQQQHGCRARLHAQPAHRPGAPAHDWRCCPMHSPADR